MKRTDQPAQALAGCNVLPKVPQGSMMVHAPMYYVRWPYGGSYVYIRTSSPDVCVNLDKYVYTFFTYTCVHV